MRRKSVTLVEVAQQAGVSLKTASLALRSDHGVSKVTRAAVHRSASRLGYQMRQSGGVIGVVAPSLNHPFYADFLQAIQNYVSHAGSGHRLSFRLSGGNVEAEDECIRALVSMRVSGLILLSPSGPVSTLRSFALDTRPIVAINVEDVKGDSAFIGLSASNREAMEKIIEYLAENGHERIAYLSGPSTSRTHQARLHGFQEAMSKRGWYDKRYEIPLASEVKPSYQAGYDGCKSLLESYGLSPTAIVAYNDVFAIGATRYILEVKHWKIPEDISIIGFDDLEICEFTTPSLSTVTLPRTLLANRAIETLLRLIECRGDTGKMQQIKREIEPLECRLKMRESSGKARSKP